MADIASLGLECDSAQIKAANVELRALPQAASAAERAAAKLNKETEKGAAANDNFTKRTQATIRALEFERAQLTRTAAEQQKYAAIRRAGVAAESVQGKAIAASVAALQAQQAATQRTAAAFGALARFLGPMAIAYGALAAAQAVFRAGMEIGDLADLAEQIGVNTNQLQAYRFAAIAAGISNEEMDASMVKLQRSMGAAAQGNAEMIARFDQLGVKLLDANGQLRPVADVLPEVAAGLLKVGSTSEQSALLMDLFGKSGTKMRTVLQDIAKGNDELVRSAQQGGGLASPATIKIWDDLGNQIGQTTAQLKVFVAELGKDVAPVVFQVASSAIAILISQLAMVFNLARQVRGLVASGAQGGTAGAVQQAQRNLDERLKEIRPGAKTSPVVEEELRVLRTELANAQAAQAAEAAAGRAAASGLQTFVPPSTGATQPRPSGGGGGGSRTAGKSAAEDAADKATEAMKRQAAAYDDLIRKGEEFIRSQELEREALFLTTEQAAALRFEEEMRNQAASQDIELTAERTAKIHEMAQAMAEAEEKTRQLTEWVDLGKDVFKGFFTDIRSGLMEGKSAWEIFSTAAINALQKIADKLFEMATNELIGKLIGQIAGGLAGGFTGTSGATALYGSSSSTLGSMSFGGPRQHGGPVSPGKAYLVGEHGPELFAPRQSGNVVPFSRGGQSIVITVAADSQWVRATARDESGRVVAQSAPAIVASAVEQSGREVVPRVERHQRQAGGEWRNG